MANKSDYLTEYRQFFLDFANTVEPNDQLPVKLGSYKFINSEVVGGLIDWCLQYLNRKSCPSSLVGPLIKITIDEIRAACKKNPLACGFNANENVYEPLKLMQTVMSKVNEVCLRYLDNAQLDTLPMPPSTPLPQISACATRNTRKRMEDRHVVIHDVNSMFNIPDSSPASYYAIFDGHAGPDAASYSAAHLHQFLVESEFYPTDPERALKEAFLRTDEFFLEKCKVENFRSGTTAVCALFRPKQETLHVAWVGDSQALLVNRGKVLQIVKPHKPCREDEKDRIEANGGCVMFWGMWRVNGQLAVSRAIGDITLKPYVTAEPDIVSIPLDGNEEFLIMACDGLWDFVSEDDAAIAVYKHIRECPENVTNIADELADLAKKGGSRDNISIIIIFFKDPIKIAKKLNTDWNWSTQKTSDVAMETGVDNTNINNSASNNFDLFDVFQKHTTLNPFSEPDYTNGKEIKNDLFTFDRPANGKRSADDFDDDDLGPETNVDEILSPIVKILEGNGNKEEKMDTMDLDFELQRQQSSEFEPVRETREETPTPPADSVLDSSGLADNVAESEESEDEWNYYKVDPKQKDISESQETNNKVSETISPPVDEMSQLNPDAKEFVPVSPSRVAVSPAPFPRDLVDDTLIAQSPRRAVPMDINVPSPVEFQFEVKQRPSELFDEFDEQKTETQNGHQLSSQEIMQNLLNGKDVSEIEFHPQNVKPVDNIFNTNLIEDSKENESPSEQPTESPVSPIRDEADFTSFIPKEQDPMSMSFYQDKEDKDFSTNPFDLNRVQVLPENIDEFIIEKSTEESQNIVPNNQETSDNENKSLLEMANSPVPQISENPLCDSAKSPIPDEAQSPLLVTATSPALESAKSPLLATSPTPEISENPFLDTAKSPAPEISSSPVLETAKSPALEIESPVCEFGSSPAPVISESSLCDLSKSPVQEINDIAKSPLLEITKSPVPEMSTSPVCEIAKSPAPELAFSPVSESPISPAPEAVTSPIPEAGDFGKSPEPEISASPVCNISERVKTPEVSESPVPEICDIAKSPIAEIATSPLPVVCDDAAKSPVPEIAPSPVPDLAKSPAPEIASSPIPDLAKSPAPEISANPVPDVAKSPAQEIAESLVPDFAKSPALEIAASLLPDLPKSPEPEITASSVPDLSKSPAPESPVPEVSDIAKSSAPEIAEILVPGVCDIAKSPLPEIAASPVPDICEISKSATPEICNIAESATPEICNIAKSATPEICNIAKSPVPEITNSVCEIAKSPALEVHSPMESPVGPLSPKSPIPELTGLVSPDITVSIKDENISGEISEAAQDLKTPELKSPLPEDKKEEDIKQTIEETLTELVEQSTDLINQISDDLQMKIDHVEESKVAELISDAIQDIVETAPAPTEEFKNESVVSTEINSFLERSSIPEVTSPLSPLETLEKFQTEAPESWKVNLEIKCETIKPEFAVHTLASPCEESKGTDTPPPTPSVVIPELQRTSPEPQEIVEAVEKLEKPEIIPETVQETKAAAKPAVKEEKVSKSTSKTTATKAAPTKKPLTNKSSPTSPSKLLPGKTSTTPAKKSTTPAKTTTTSTLKSKPSTTPVASPRTTTTKTTPKPATTPSKLLEKKPLTNGDIKPAVKTTLVKKTTSTTSTSTTGSKTTTTAKLSPTKTPTSRSSSASAAKPAPKPATARPATATSATASAAPKPRPASLTSRTTTTSAATTKTAPRPATTGSTRTSTTSTAKPKPTTSTTAAPKPRLTATRPATKAPDTEKQIKETTNKQLSASKTTTRTSSSAAKTTSSTLKKVDPKTSVTARTATTRTTTTTLKSTSKKPAETKTTITKTTKTITKPMVEQNGVVNITQEITTTIEEPQLLKDNSPVEIEMDNSKLAEIIAD